MTVIAALDHFSMLWIRLPYANVSISLIWLPKFKPSGESWSCSSPPSEFPWCFPLNGVIRTVQGKTARSWLPSNPEGVVETLKHYLWVINSFPYMCARVLSPSLSDLTTAHLKVYRLNAPCLNASPHERTNPWSECSTLLDWMHHPKYAYRKVLMKLVKTYAIGGLR